MRFLSPALALVLLAVPATPAAAQFTDQFALEAAVRTLHPGPGIAVFISPIMVAPEVNGRVRINEDNLEKLQARFNVEVMDPGDAVTCQHPTRPATCTIKDGGVIFQFFMPKPVQNGVLGLSILLLKDGAGQNGQIGREWWNVALVEDPDEGWTVVEHELAETADGPW